MLYLSTSGSEKNNKAYFLVHKYACYLLSLHHKDNINGNIEAGYGSKHH